jgi:hypothetical protein
LLPHSRPTEQRVHLQNCLGVGAWNKCGHVAWATQHRQWWEVWRLPLVLCFNLVILQAWSPCSTCKLRCYVGLELCLGSCLVSAAADCLVCFRWQDLRVIYRPLLFYACTEALSYYSRFALRAMGFTLSKSHTVCGHELLVATRGIPPPVVSGEVSSLAVVPVVFLHGAGVGLLPYLNFLR